MSTSFEEISEKRTKRSHQPSAALQANYFFVTDDGIFDLIAQGHRLSDDRQRIKTASNVLLKCRQLHM